MLKCPDHIFALDAIRAVYPDADLVFVHRDPVAVLASVARLTEVLRRPFSRRIDRIEIGREDSERWLTAAGLMIAAADEEGFAQPIFHIHYADLVADPVGMVAALYRHFGRALDPDAAARIGRRVAANPNGGYGGQRARLEDYGLDPAREHGRYDATWPVSESSPNRAGDRPAASVPSSRRSGRDGRVRREYPLAAACHRRSWGAPSGLPPNCPADTGLGVAASSAGIKTRLATSVQPRLISNNVPMLAVPGCWDSASEPNAVPVVSAENRIARAVAEPSTAAAPGAPIHHEVDVKGDPDTEQQRQRNDIRVIQRQRHQHHDDHGHQRREQQRRQHQRHVEHATQCHKQNDGDRHQGADRGRAEGADDRRTARLDRHRRPAGIRGDGGDLSDEFLRPAAVVRLRLWQDLDARAPVGQNPVARQRRGNVCTVTGLASSAVRRWSSCVGRKRVSAASAVSTTGSGAAARRRRSSAIAASSGSGEGFVSAGAIAAKAFFAAARISSAVGGGRGVGSEGRAQQGRRIRDLRELCLLVFRHEAVDRQHSRNQRQMFQPFRQVAPRRPRSASRCRS